jgi:predicted alpha/beta hydrolase family esterase
MIIPGNGNADMSEIWYPYAKKGLEALGITVIAKNMPDPDLGSMKYWLPFIEMEIGEGPDTILIGHSTGAVAIMRYLETHRILGSVLVGACYTDLGYTTEKESGYYDKEWDWSAIKNNAKWILQFASTNDPYIPIEDARFIRDKLNSKYYEYSDQGHFSDDVHKTEFPELVSAIQEMTKPQ